MTRRVTAAALWQMQSAAIAGSLGAYSRMFGVLAAINTAGVLLALGSPTPHEQHA